MNKILVVDDEKGVRHSFKKILSRCGYDVITAENGTEAVEKASSENPDLVIMDVTMPGMDGLETLKRLKSGNHSITVIMMTAYSTSERAITAMKYGAYDYLTKPFDNDTLIALVKKAIMDGKMSTPVTFDGLDEEEEGDRIIGRSPVMLNIFKKIGQVAETDVTVLLRGETGTGKELIARALYHHSRRVNRPFLPVNCAAIPENLLESEIFGHERGAFTGADTRRIGKFEQCDGGTMFLDEIGDMPLSLQAKLLRVLQDGSFQRLGGKELIRADVRIIAATNKDLEALRDRGEFRDDLYWRLNVVSITLPPLRERKEDISEIVRYFIRRFNRELGKNVKGISPELLDEFHSYHWPGNVRELQSIIQRGMVLCQRDILSHNDCESLSQPETRAAETGDVRKMLSGAVDRILQAGGSDIYREAVTDFERLLIEKALQLNNNNQALTARMLGISRNTLKAKLEGK
ncbi:MAG: sigma-54-dependent Fis family transcriptional regulator [Deferribacteres bacterium]|nr:sigma-54-dependent Fis family transcriptional regulator [Deferribacteres bacterium]